MKVIKMLKRKIELNRKSRANSDWSINLGYYRNRGLLNTFTDRIEIDAVEGKYIFNSPKPQGFSYTFKNEDRDKDPGTAVLRFNN